MSAYQTGWLLFALMIALTVFNARKKIPFLPLFSARAWLQFHIWTGFLSAIIFFWHIGWRLPFGWFNWSFTAVYALVMISGIVGLVWSRTIPRRLTARGGEVIWEQIPSRRAALRAEAESVALRLVGDTPAETVAQFYSEHLHDFFAGAPGAPRELLGGLENLKRFVNDQERGVVEQLAALVRKKDDLDFHYAQQWRLKAWLFLHIPLTYSLLVFSAVHIVVVYAFSGRAP
jgi:hypothetical protein